MMEQQLEIERQREEQRLKDERRMRHLEAKRAEKQSESKRI